MALEKLQGTPDYQYTRLWDYADELRKRNPGSTVILGIEEVGVTKRFSKFYICLDALKKVWRDGWRPIIGVDGCHLSGPHKGILLTAVWVDPNNALYPLAYAVVSKECFETLEWFLGILKVDLQLHEVPYLKFISDKQKGLIQSTQYLCTSPQALNF